MTCKHIAWLHVKHGNEAALIDPGRMTRLAGELAAPLTQRPSIISFVGQRTRSLAVREIFPDNRFNKGKREGIATLRLDNTSLFSDYPVFFAETYPSASFSVGTDSTFCYGTESYPLKWTEDLVEDFYNILYIRLFCLFTDVICIFADDFRNFQDVINLLKTWAAAGSVSSPWKISSRVVIIKQGVDVEPSPIYNILQMESV
jgi:hypothetical protein